MRVEDIKKIMTKLIYRQQIQLNECTFFIEQYIEERTGKKININLMSAPFDMASIDVAVNFALDYFKVKFNCLILRNKESLGSQIISINYQ